MRVSSRPHPITRLLLSLLVPAAIHHAAASTHTWNGGLTGAWSNPANWTGGVPTSNETGFGTIVVFNSNVSSTCDIVGLVVDKIIFNGGGNTIGGTTPLGIKGDMSQYNIQNVSGTNTLASSLALAFTGNSTIFVPVDGGALTIASNISGTRGLRLVAGTLTLTGNNTYTGDTTVQAGTLFLNSNGFNTAIVGNLVVGTGNDSGATVTLQQSIEIADTSKVTVRADGVLNLNDKGDVIGALDIIGGNVAIGTGNLTTSGLLSMTSGSIAGSPTGILHLKGDITATSTISAFPGISCPMTLNGARTLTINNGPSGADMVLSSVISDGIGVSSFTKLGEGTLLMTTSAANTYTGGTFVQAGTVTLNGNSSAVINGNLTIGTGSGTPGTTGIVRLGQSSEIVNTAVVTVNGGGLLDMNSFFDEVGTLNLSGGVTVGSGASAHLLVTTTNIFPGGDLNFIGGKFTSNGLLTMSGGTITGNGSLLVLGGNISATAPGTPPVITANVSLTGTRTVTVAPGSAQPELTVVGVISETVAGSGLIKAGTGTLKLNNPSSNTFTGTTSVAKGVLQILADVGRTIPGPLAIGNNIDPAGSAVVQELINNNITTTAPVTLGSSGTLDLNNRSETIGALSGSGNILLSGPSSLLTVNSDNSSTSFSGSVTGAGTFRKSGTGTLGFTGTMASTVARATVADGTLLCTFGPGSGSPLNFQIGDDTGAAASAIARFGANTQFAATTTVDIRPDGRLDVNGTTSSVGNVSINKGSIDLDGGQLTLKGLTMSDGSVSGAGTLGLAGPLTASAVTTGASISSNVALTGSPLITVNSGAVQPELLFSGVISDGPGGPGGFTKTGLGTLRYGGSGNTFTGTATIDKGLFQMNAANTSTIVRRLIIGNDVDPADSATARNLVNLNFSSVAEVIIKGSGKLDLNNFGDRAGSLSGNGGVFLGSAQLAVGQSGSSSTFDGLITGTGGISKLGGGTFTMTRDNTYSGQTIANDGLLLINGNQTTTNVAVAATGTFGGTGLVGTPLTATIAGSRVAPGGASPGILRVSGAANLAGARLVVRLNDAAAVKADQLLVSGNLDITGAKLGPIPSGPISATPYVIATYGAFGGTLTGTFGSVPPGCTVNYAFNDGSGPNHIAITVTNPWQAWLAGYGLDPATTGAQDFDFDKDGIPNVIEFVLGTDPTKSFAGAVTPDISISGSNVVFSFRRNGAAAYLNPSAETRNTLGGVGPWTTIASGIVVTPNFFSPGIDKVTVTIPKAGRTKLFCRLQAAVL